MAAFNLLERYVWTYSRAQRGIKDWNSLSLCVSETTLSGRHIDLPHPHPHSFHRHTLGIWNRPMMRLEA
jgi:hypothetical protein